MDLHHLYDVLTIAEDAIEAAQQYRYGNIHITSAKLLKLSMDAHRLGNVLYELSQNGAKIVMEDEEDYEI